VSKTIGAIDIGTNSLHLLVAQVQDDGSFRIVTREKEPVRLGSGGGDMKVLAADAIDRGIACLTRFRHIAEQWDAEVTALATSAVREANNRDVFVNRARQEAGVDIKIISGIEEARLIHLGVLQSVPVGSRRHLGVDIGGGSTEFIVGDGTSPLLLRSLKLGAIRLTDRFFPGGIVDDRSLEACRLYVRGFLSSVVREIAELEPSLAIASSGTAETLAWLAGDEERITTPDLQAVTDRVLASTTPDQRKSNFGLDERRSDIIAAGAVLFTEITHALGVEEWTISDLALRAGIVFDMTYRDRAGQGLHRLTDLRRESVITVAERFHEDIDHAEHITDLALELFDATSTVHDLQDDDRVLLEAAGLLHNIGLYVAHSAHHKHSYYLIRHAEQLAGFTDHETELIAQVARYHRKSAPKSKHDEWEALSEPDKERVTTLAAILRIAIGLDRGDRTVVHSVEAEVSKSTIVIKAHTRPGVDADLEIYSARARASLFAVVTGRTIEVLVEPAGDLRRSHPSDQ
jgi:exopolyphosphatase/guanosine-5'-triphosphate,3'-diphosphate pyrophosphatase